MFFTVITPNVISLEFISRRGHAGSKGAFKILVDIDILLSKMAY